MGFDRICDERGRGSDWESTPPPSRGGGLRLSRLRFLRSRLRSHGEKDGERRWRGGDEEELLKDEDPRCRGGIRERARIGLREWERERCGESPNETKRSLEGVLPRGETRRAILWTLKDVRCVLWIESEGRIAHASTAAPAIVSQSTVVSDSASPHRGQTSPSAQAHEFRQVSACDRALLARGYHLPWHGAFLYSSLPRSFVECPPGNTSINKFRMAAMNTRVESVRKPVGLICRAGVVKQKEWRVFTA